MRLYRIHRSIYKGDDGEGARLYGGRWNSPGRAVIYASEHPALAAFEVAVHQKALPLDRVITYITVPEQPEVQVARALLRTELDPADIATFGEVIYWINPDSFESVESACLYIGNDWLEYKRSLVLQVPSFAVQNTHNYLINPEHPEFKKLVFSEPKPFTFDPRLPKLDA